MDYSYNLSVLSYTHIIIKMINNTFDIRAILQNSNNFNSNTNDRRTAKFTCPAQHLIGENISPVVTSKLWKYVFSGNS